MEYNFSQIQVFTQGFQVQTAYLSPLGKKGVQVSLLIIFLSILSDTSVDVV